MLKPTLYALFLFSLVLVVSCAGSTAVSPDTMSDRDMESQSGRTDDELGVAVTPQTFLLGSNQGGSVVVHTSIPYGSVHRFTLELNGVPVRSTKADDCGDLVAYFDEALIKAIVTPPDEVMTLTGTYTSGESFEGSDTVKVIQ